MIQAARRLTSLVLLAGALALAPDAGAAQATPSQSDSLLASRVEAAISAASDVPADSIAVSVRGGVVTLTGSVMCADCGGTRTPSGTGTVQQSLGAVVRAVPGVDQVRFELVYRRP